MPHVKFFGHGGASAVSEDGTPKHKVTRTSLDDENGGEIPHSRQLYADVLRIAWPSCVELLLTQLASMVDLMMVGNIGPWAITSVGLTTQPKFVLMALFMAMNVGATAMVARFRGAGNQEGANLVLRQSLMMTFVLSVAASVIGFIFAEPMMAFMGAADAQTLQGATVYFKIQMVGFVFMALTTTVTATMRGVGNSRVAMIYNLIANIVNVIFNYLFIEGNLGFPRLEVAGASLATIIGQFVAFAIAMSMILRHGHYLHISVRDSYRPDFDIIRRICRIGVPAMLEQITLRCGLIVFSKVVASLGTLAFATHQVCLNIQSLSFMNGQAFGVAATSLMGQSLGRNRPDFAEAYSSRARRMGMLVSLILACVFFFFGRYIIALYNDDPYIINMGGTLLMMLAAIQPLQSSQLILSGALRGAGDTRSIAVILFVTTFLIRPLLAMLTVYVFHWGLIGAWIALAVDQLLRSLLVLFRFNSGKWKKIQV